MMLGANCSNCNSDSVCLPKFSVIRLLDFHYIKTLLSFPPVESVLCMTIINVEIHTRYALSYSYVTQIKIVGCLLTQIHLPQLIRSLLP